MPDRVIPGNPKKRLKPILPLGLRDVRLKNKKSGPFIRNSKQRYGAEEKVAKPLTSAHLKAFDSFSLGMDFLMAILV